jgi:hypothetical protein
MTQPQRTIDREAWNALTPYGDPLECTVTVRPAGVYIEDGDGEVQVGAYALEDGVDLRVGDVQFIVQGRQVKVVQSHPPYPISRWTVLWEGELR